MHSKKIVFIVCILVCFAASSSLRAEIPNELEPAYSEAVIAFNKKDYSVALSQLDQVLARDRNLIEALELKALTLKAKGENQRAIELYENLVRLKVARTNDPQTAGPYYFELGQLHLKTKETDKARAEFHRSVEAKFNIPASRYYLGTISFERKHWDSAEAYFLDVIASDAEALKPLSHFYLGQIAGISRDATTAAKQFLRASNRAHEQLAERGIPEGSQKIAQQLLTSVDKVLNNLNRQSVVATAGLLTGYDTNVLYVPVDSISPFATSGASSVKTTLQAGLSYATSPFSKFQFIPTYQGSMNYNFNRDTAEGQFMSHSLALYFNHDPLSDMVIGFKLEGNLTLQYSRTDASASGSYATYSLIGSLGPYFRLDLNKRWLLGIDLVFQPQKYYIDTTLPSNFARSGYDGQMRVFLRNDRKRHLWNPTVALTTDFDLTTGTEFRSKTVGLQASDKLYFSRTLTAALIANLGYSLYSVREDGSRSDQSISFTANLTKQVTQSFSVLGEMHYLQNLSNVADYKYNRFIATAGVVAVF